MVTFRKNVTPVFKIFFLMHDVERNLPGKATRPLRIRVITITFGCFLGEGVGWGGGGGRALGMGKGMGVGKFTALTQGNEAFYSIYLGGMGGGGLSGFILHVCLLSPGADTIPFSTNIVDHLLASSRSLATSLRARLTELRLRCSSSFAFSS